MINQSVHAEIVSFYIYLSFHDWWPLLLWIIDKGIILLQFWLLFVSMDKGIWVTGCQKP